jgi:hypothetical protein
MSATTTPTTGSVGKGFIQCILIGILFVFVGVYSKYSKPTPSPPPARSQASPVAPTAPSVIQVGKEKMLYRFGTDGCITKFLQGGWSDYPKGGEISFIDLSTGLTVLKDKPGTSTGSSLPPGNYRICKISPDAWGVDIWQ